MLKTEKMEPISHQLSVTGWNQQKILDWRNTFDPVLSQISLIHIYIDVFRCFPSWMAVEAHISHICLAFALRLILVSAIGLAKRSSFYWSCLATDVFPLLRGLGGSRPCQNLYDKKIINKTSTNTTTISGQHNNINVNPIIKAASENT